MGQVNWICDNIIKKDYMTNKTDNTMSYTGYVYFILKWLDVAIKIIKKELHCWEKYLLWGFGSRHDCQQWLTTDKDVQNASTRDQSVFMIRFSTSNPGTPEKAVAIAITYTEAKGSNKMPSSFLVNFDPESQNYWMEWSNDARCITGKTLFEFINNL